MNRREIKIEADYSGNEPQNTFYCKNEKGEWKVIGNTSELTNDYSNKRINECAIEIVKVINDTYSIRDRGVDIYFKGKEEDFSALEDAVDYIMNVNEDYINIWYDTEEDVNGEENVNDDADCDDMWDDEYWDEVINECKEDWLANFITAYNNRRIKKSKIKLYPLLVNCAERITRIGKIKVDGQRCINYWVEQVSRLENLQSGGIPYIYDVLLPFIYNLSKNIGIEESDTYEESQFHMSYITITANLIYYLYNGEVKRSNFVQDFGKKYLDCLEKVIERLFVEQLSDVRFIMNQVVAEVRKQRRLVNKKIADDSKIDETDIPLERINILEIYNQSDGQYLLHEKVRCYYGKEQIELWHNNKVNENLTDPELDYFKLVFSLENAIAENYNNANRIHEIWYCINPEDEYRYENLAICVWALESLDIPVTIVFNNSEGCEEKLNEIKRKIENVSKVQIPIETVFNTYGLIKTTLDKIWDNTEEKITRPVTVNRYFNV